MTPLNSEFLRGQAVNYAGLYLAASKCLFERVKCGLDSGVVEGNQEKETKHFETSKKKQPPHHRQRCLTEALRGIKYTPMNF